MINKILLALIMTLSLMATSSLVSAEEHPAPTATAPATSADVIKHINLGLEEVKKSDFAAAKLHLKAARTASDNIAGNDDTKKNGLAKINDGMKAASSGDVEKATTELNDAIKIYESIK
jgi:Tfp pilus assembly protein PilF